MQDKEKIVPTGGGILGQIDKRTTYSVMGGLSFIQSLEKMFADTISYAEQTRWANTAIVFGTGEEPVSKWKRKKALGLTKKQQNKNGNNRQEDSL
jgi:hypothetical protein